MSAYQAIRIHEGPFLATLAFILFAFAALGPGASEAANPILLFDGKTFSGWTTVDGKPVPPGWEVVDGAIHLHPQGSRPGNIVTDRDFGDFDLQFEWKISSGSNSGIKYRVRKYPNKGFLGCEYQIIDDDSLGDRLNEKQLTGSLYAVYEPDPNRLLMPVGQYNHSRIVVWGDRIQHWLNGQLVVSAEIGSSEWADRIADSKFRDVEGFGQNHLGRIMLTDHNSEVWYRNLILRELPSADELLTSNCGVARRPCRPAHRICRRGLFWPRARFRCR